MNIDKFDSFLILEKDFDRSEAEGAVPKQWVKTPLGEALFKDAGQNQYNPEMRSDWSEKIVYELANRLSLPAARYELAQLGSDEGEIAGSISFKLSNYGGVREPVEAILEKSIENYNYGSDYSVSSVINILEKQNVRIPPNHSLPEGINNGADMFVGALMLDAYTCNIDRHSRNFDIITLSNEGIQYLSPIFDNGRSLGSFLQDDIKVNRSISDYAKSTQSSITVEGYKKNGLETFKEASLLRPQAAKIWLHQLSQISTQEIQKLIDRIPEDRITPISKNFAFDLLNHNQSQLLSLNLDYKQNTDINFQSASSTASASNTYSSQEITAPERNINDLYAEYEKNTKSKGLAQAKEIAKFALVAGIKPEQAAQMLTENNSAYQELIARSGAKQAQKLIVQKARTEITISRSDRTSQQQSPETKPKRNNSR